MHRAGQSSPRLPRQSRALPRSPLPSRAAAMGQLRPLEADAACDPSRKHHPGVPSAGSRLCSRGSSWNCPRTGVGRQWRAQAPSRLPPLFPGWLGMPLPRAVREPVPKKCYLVLHNLIVTEMRSNRRVSPRKVVFLNHCSIMLLHGTQKITPMAFSSSHLSKDDRVGGLCSVTPVKFNFYVHKQFKYL